MTEYVVVHSLAELGGLDYMRDNVIVGCCGLDDADARDVQDVYQVAIKAGHAMTCAEYREQVIRELIEKAGETSTHFPAWFVRDNKPDEQGYHDGPPESVLLADWLKSQIEGE